MNNEALHATIDSAIREAGKHNLKRTIQPERSDKHTRRTQAPE